MKVTLTASMSVVSFHAPDTPLAMKMFAKPAMILEVIRKSAVPVDGHQSVLFQPFFIGAKSDENIDDDWFISGEFGHRGRFGPFTRLFSTFGYKPDLDLESVGAAINYPISPTCPELRYAYDVETSSVTTMPELTGKGSI